MDTAHTIRELVQTQLGSQVLALCEAHARIAELTARVEALTAERDAALAKQPCDGA